MSGRASDGSIAQDSDPASAGFTEPDLSIQITVDPDIALPGEHIAVQIVVTNDGGSDAEGVSVRSLPDGVTCDLVVDAGGADCIDDPDGSYLQWDELTVPAGGETKRGYTFAAPADAPRLRTGS